MGIMYTYGVLTYTGRQNTHTHKIKMNKKERKKKKRKGLPMYLKIFLGGICVIRTWAEKPSGLSARSMGQNFKVVPTSDLLEAHTVFSHPLMFEPPAWAPVVAWLWLESVLQKFVVLEA